MRLLACASSLLCMLAWTPAFAGTLAAEPVAVVPFELEDGRIVIPMRIDGSSREARLLLDSGLTFEGAYLFHSRWVEELGLDVSRELGVAGAGAEEPTSSVIGEHRTLRAGDATFRGQTLYVSRGPRTQNFPRDGAVGWTLLGNHVVHVDHGSRTIRLYDPEGFEPDAGWVPVELELKDRIPWIRVGVSVVDEPVRDGRMYIDLGAGDSLLILVREGMKYPVPTATERRYVGTGLSGDVYGDFGRVRQVRIGELRLDDVPVVFTPAEMRSKRDGADGIVGSALLLSFDVVFDYRGARMYLRRHDGR